MAEGTIRVFGADVAVATTGIAGPGGGTTRKPVGLVYIAASGPNGTVIQEHVFPGNRAAIMDAAATAALNLLVSTVEEALSL
jgi:PncC family amidohydrolase